VISTVVLRIYNALGCDRSLDYLRGHAYYLQKIIEPEREGDCVISGNKSLTCYSKELR
jgi:hypothetical protein